MHTSVDACLTTVSPNIDKFLLNCFIKKDEPDILEGKGFREEQ